VKTPSNLPDTACPRAIIITILKFNSRVNPGQDLGYRTGGQPGLTHVNVKIKIVIIIVLKPDLGVDRGKA